jgi:uncharacterized protein
MSGARVEIPRAASSRRCAKLLLLMTVCGWLPVANAVQRVSSPGVYQGYSEPRYSEWVLKSQYVAVRDGTRLAVDIYRPAVGGKAVDDKLPVIWVHTPYRRAFIDAAGMRVSAAEQQGLLQLLRYGYVIAVVDTRGRGASLGVRRGFQDRTEARDAYDMTEWLAAQPWSDGNIGISGCSYVGGSTFHATTLGAPHLRAAAPGCTDFDKYGFVSRGGITAQFNTRPENPEQDYGQGVAPVDEDADGRIAAQAIEVHKTGTPMAELWRGMPFRDDVSPLVGTRFWQEVDVGRYAHTIERSGIGLFIWGNWKDEGSFEATLAFNNLSNPRKLWMGGWGHCQTADFPMAIELLRFFDHFLKRIDNGWSREPPIYYYTIHAPKGQEWHSAARWPLPDVHMQRLRLAGAAAPDQPGALAALPTPLCADLPAEGRPVFHVLALRRRSAWAELSDGTAGARHACGRQSAGRPMDILQHAGRRPVRLPGGHRAGWQHRHRDSWPPACVASR